MNEEKPVTSDNKKLSPEEIKRVKGSGMSSGQTI